jgi:hypothetical protein
MRGHQQNPDDPDLQPQTDIGTIAAFDKSCRQIEPFSET